LNLVILQGNITKDIDVKVKGELVIANFSMAVSRMKKGETDFFNCTAFNKNAELIGNSLHKGSPILINGHLQNSSYEKDGHTVYKTDVIVDRFDFIGKKEDNTSNTPPSQNNDITPIDDGDIPF